MVPQSRSHGASRSFKGIYMQRNYGNVPRSPELSTIFDTSREIMKRKRTLYLRLAYPLMIIALLLSSCTTYRRSTDSDTYPAMPATKRGQKPYTVNGIRYEPLSSHDGFEQSGIASSYGADFHGKTTSSGEPFDMDAMTAAHKTLPLGVYVKVVHQRSGKSVVAVSTTGDRLFGTESSICPKAQLTDWAYSRKVWHRSG